MTEAAIIAVVDLETTGFDPAEHAPIEIGWTALTAPKDLLGGPDWGQADLRLNGWRNILVKPGRSVPPESSAIHHLTDDDLAEAAGWGLALRMFRADCGLPVAFAAHNARFERQWCAPHLVGPAPWICTHKCALRAWPDAPGHGNQVLRYWLSGQGLLEGFRREMASPAHRAGPDAYVTAHILIELLRRHPLEDLLRWSDEPAVLTRVPFGRRPEEGGSRGLKWTEIDDGLLDWVRGRDMGEDINHTAQIEHARRRDDRDKDLP